MKSIFVVLIPVLAIAACGGSVVNGVNNGGDGGTGSDAGGGDGGFITSCPNTEPSPGTSCAPEGIDCEYGTSNGSCNNPDIQCTNGEWKLPPPTPGPACLPSNACPTSHSSIVVGQDCGAEELECNYPGQGRCTCATKGFGGPPLADPDGGPIPNVWECEQPTSGCAVDRPRLGSACTTEGQSCTYGGCDMPDSVSIGCTNGVWVNEPFACAG
jgi:hypothetical protein